MSRQPEDTVRLGLMAPLSGLVAIYGEEISRAGRIAADVINSEGGISGRPMELLVVDDGSLPQTAVPAAAKLVDEAACHGIIGNLLSNSRIAVADNVAIPKRIPYLNFSFYEGSIASRYFFHFAALPNQQIEMMIPFMAGRCGMKFYFAGNNYEWPRGSIDAAKRSLEGLGGEVLGEQYLAIGAKEEEIDRVLDELAYSGADVFVPYFAGTDQMHLLNKFHKRGLKNQMAVVMGHYDEVMVSYLRPEVREGLYSSNTYFMSVSTRANQLYLKRLQGLPGVDGIWPHGNGALTNFGEATYNCVMAFADAARRAGSLDSADLIPALETVRIQGPQGEVVVDRETHHAHVNSYLTRCESDGTFKIIKQFGRIPPKIPERYKALFKESAVHGDPAVLPEAGDLVKKVARYRERNRDIRDILAVTDIAVLATDIFGRITAANENAADMFGYEMDEMSGMAVQLLVPPHLRQRHKKWMQDFLESDTKARGLGKRRPATGYRKDGSFFPLHASVAKFKSGNQWTVVATLRDATEITEAKAALTRQATHDPLTGLPNRMLIQERLDNALKHSLRLKESVALLFVDLDEFKVVNDTHGHDAGDFLLKVISGRFMENVRPGDIVARLSGDEFLVLCEYVSDPTHISGLAQRINAFIREPVEYNGTCLFVTASIGVAMGHGTTHSAEDMLRDADNAMSVVKQKRRDSWQFFNRSLQKEVQKRLEISTGLRFAIERNELALVFQPIVRLEDKAIRGAEALLRWHPQGGAVSPAMFIPVAEMTGTIVPIGRWVFEEVCRAQRRWSEKLGDRCPYIAFNLSARQLSDEHLVETFTGILDRTQADPRRLVLEVTETSLMSDISSNLAVLEELRSTGMAVAVDDFGTGYSSLAQLLRLNVDTLKIDRAFINGIEKNPENEVVVSAICRMGKALRLKLVAEGVENETQRAIMVSLGCQSSQGYLFYKPMTEDSLLKIINDRPKSGQLRQESLSFLIYTSRAMENTGEEDFKDILETARRSNLRNQVTGYLVFNDGVFLQYIEGGKPTIDRLYKKICRDSRHTGVTLVANGPLTERLFMNWHMGFRTMGRLELPFRDQDWFTLYRDNPALCCNLFETISRSV